MLFAVQRNEASKEDSRNHKKVHESLLRRKNEKLD